MLSFYDTFTALGLDDLTQPLNGLTGLAKSAGWCWFYRDLVIVCDRPELLKLDNQRRMHCEDGPAIQYRDGWGFYMWHGTMVPASVIEEDPSTWDIKQVMNERNAEIRRCMIERLGWDAFIDMAKLVEVDRQDDPANPGCDIALYDVPERIYDEAVRVILVTNASPERDGTRRRFGLTVPANINDAVEAAAWTFDVSRNEYKQLVRCT